MVGYDCACVSRFVYVCVLLRMFVYDRVFCAYGYVCLSIFAYVCVCLSMDAYACL